MADDGSKTFDKILRGAKIAGAVAAEGVLAATGTHPSLHGNDDWSLIAKARGKTKKGEGLGKTDASEIGRPANARSMEDILAGKGDKKKESKTGKFAKAALGALASGAPQAPVESVQYMPTSVSFSPVPYSGGRPTRTKEEYSKGKD